MSWLQAISIVAAVVGWCVVLGLVLWAAMDGDGWPWRWPVVAVGSFILMFSMAALIRDTANSSDERRQDCADRGGQLVQTGTRPQLVGKVIVQTPVFICGIIEGEG